MDRRAFLCQNLLTIAASGAISESRHEVLANEAMPVLKFGLFTDMHHADKPSAGTRYYRETLNKFAEASLKIGQQKPGFIVELGDLIDAADSVEVELSYLKRINAEFKKLAEKRYYVLGNHCVDTLTKQEFLGEVGQPKSYFSFDHAGWHFVVLDACFRSDGQPYQRKNFQWTDANIPQDELDWLVADLKLSGKNTIVFAHQRLDETASHSVKNAAVVRRILEQSGCVKAVFQGHSHKNDLQQINSIAYVTFVAMIEGSGPENNGYSLVQIDQNGTIHIHGFRQQVDRELG